MAWYALFYVIIQVTAMYFGVRNLLLGFNRYQSWTFSIRKHSKIGFTFVVLTVTGYLLDFFITRILSSHGQPISITGHRLISMLTIIFIIPFVISGLMKQKHTNRLQWLQFLHPWIGLLTIGLMLSQIFLVLVKLIGW
jgi:hypothetical protein